MPWLLVLVLSGSSTVFALSEEKEIELGRQEHRKIVARFGLYRDKELASYITKIGERIAKESSRPDLQYHFTVLNDDLVNAFALPGGYIYVTRGMLTHMNSESELAAVLGHEIAHVTERHAIRAQTRGKVINVLNTVAAGITGIPGAYDLGNIFGGVLQKGYSRKFELEADKVGAEYMAKAGYSPEAMLKTIDVLKAKDRIEIEQARMEKREPQIYHGILSTHPDHDTRYKKAIRASNKLGANYTEFIKTDEFLEKLNGLAYGNSRQVGVVRKNKYFYPKLGIKLSFPQKWRIEAGRRGIYAISQQGDATLVISSGRLYKGVTPKGYAKDKLMLNVREGSTLTIAGMPGYIGIADDATSPYGPRPIRFVVLFDIRKRRAFILKGAGKYDLTKIAADKSFITTIFSFDRMDKEDFRKARVPKIQIVRAEKGTTMESLAAESPITNYALDKLRVMNGLYPSGQPEEGQLIKIVN